MQIDERVQKVVLAGMKVMYDKKTFQIFKNGMMRKDVPLPERLAEEAAGLIKILVDKSKNTIPADVMPSAAAMLLLEMGKFITETGEESPTSEDMRQSITILMELLKKVFPADEQQAPVAPQQPQPAPQPAPQGGLLSQGV